MSVLSGRPRAFSTVRERAQGLLTPLNLHWAAVALLGLVNVYLLIHMVVAWRTVSSQDQDALQGQRVRLQTAKIAAKPLQGLDGKLRMASLEADRFSVERLPVSYSEVASELGRLKSANNVRLTRATYTQSAVAGDAAGQLTQVQIDAGLSGDYRGLMLFINGLERDKVFFLITGITLTGQQSGVVNLRIRMVTYIRGGVSDEDRAAVEIAPPAAKDPDAAPAVSGLGGAR